MKKVLVLVAVLLTMLFIAVAIGFSLPVAHTVKRTIVLRAAPADVWATISNVAAYPAWRPDVDSVEMLAPVGGRPAWRETGSNGEITYAMTRVDPPSTLVTRITDQDLPFGGEWHFAVAREGRGTRVSITEHGEVYSPVYRFVARFVMGHTSTIDAYLRALGAKHGETVEPETGAGSESRSAPGVAGSRRLPSSTVVTRSNLGRERHEVSGSASNPPGRLAFLMPVLT